MYEQYTLLTGLMQLCQLTNTTFFFSPEWKKSPHEKPDENLILKIMIRMDVRNQPILRHTHGTEEKMEKKMTCIS